LANGRATHAGDYFSFSPREDKGKRRVIKLYEQLIKIFILTVKSELIYVFRISDLPTHAVLVTPSVGKQRELMQSPNTFVF